MTSGSAPEDAAAAAAGAAAPVTDSRLPELLLGGLAFAESPRWHDGALWFSDFYLGQVLRVDLNGRTQVVAELLQQPSGLGWTPDARLLVVSMLDHRLMQLDRRTLVQVADLSQIATGPCNDMVVDARGGAYIGNFGFDLFARPLQPAPARLAYVAPDGAVRVVAEDLMFPNGAVITPDGGTLVIAETFGHRLTAFRIGADGSLHDRRLWAALDGLSPDGICLDAEGAIWVASPRSSAFLRVLEGGAITDRIASEHPAVACALGGVDGRRLFMLSGKVRPRQPSLGDRAGRIHWLDVAVPAAAAPA